MVNSIFVNNKMRNILFVPYSELNDYSIQNFNIQNIVMCDKLCILDEKASQCDIFEIVNKSNFVSSLLISQYLNDYMHNNVIAIVYENNKYIAMLGIVSYLCIFSGLNMHSDNVLKYINNVSNHINLNFELDTTIKFINDELLSIGFTIDSWKISSMTQLEFKKLLNYDIGEFEKYSETYPSEFPDISPLSDNIKQDCENNIMPDKAKSVNNRSRKDHTVDLINKNEKECFLLLNGYYDKCIPILSETNNNNNVTLTSEFITNIHADAYVNTANEALQGGGGMDLLIHKYAGDSLKVETSQLPNVLKGDYYYGVKCMTGDAKITSGHNLKATYIVHVVTPYLNNDGIPNKKMHVQSYKSILKYIDNDHIKSIVIGPISTGYYGYPMLEATVLGLLTIKKYLSINSDFPVIKLWIYNETQFKIHEKLLSAFNL